MIKCKDCHLCCEYFIIPLSDIPDDIEEFFRVWGVTIVKDGESAVLKIYSPCQHLRAKGCAIYEKRPEYCRKFECDVLKNGHNRGKKI